MPRRLETPPLSLNCALANHPDHTAAWQCEPFKSHQHMLVSLNYAIIFDIPAPFVAQNPSHDG
jgi:hypothetical protein